MKAGRALLYRDGPRLFALRSLLLACLLACLRGVWALARALARGPAYPSKVRGELCHLGPFRD